MAYCDYDFYLNVYFGNCVSEGDFPRLSERASDYIRSATQGAAENVVGWQLEAVKKCTCAIADILLDEEIITANVYSSGQQVSSESVGNWSKNYKSQSLSTAEVENISTRKRGALLLYLGGLAAFERIFKVRSFPCLHRRG